MTKNTRTFADIDLNFTTFPLSLERNTGIGTITTNNTSTAVTGIGTQFNSDWVNRNLYVNGNLVGKVKTVISVTSIVLYANALVNSTSSAFTWSVPTDIVRRYDDNAIKASIRNLVLTKNFERAFHSEIGTPLASLLFEPTSPMLAQLISRVIQQTIVNFEPRVNLLGVDTKFSPDNNSVYCSITYKIVNTSTPQTINLTLKRTR